MLPQLKSNISSWTSRTIKTYFSFNVIFFILEISNNVKVFLFLFYYFFYKKILVPLVPEVPRSADPQFSNTLLNGHICLLPAKIYIHVLIFKKENKDDDFC